MSQEEDKKLGKLSRISLRDYWENEAQDFTPWLAQDENIALLGDTIGQELEVVGIEKQVGSFKVDILAKYTDSDDYVVIENQLEKTNHSHLGQLLTYASGYEAKIVVWIAKEISEEHRRALDWLNEKTPSGIAFFGLEIELWKIGESQPAPKFNLVSQPNDWGKIINQDKTTRGKTTETKLAQKKFWEQWVEYMKENGTFLRIQKPRLQHWLTIPVGRSGFSLALTLHSQKKRIGCELYISVDNSKTYFDRLYEQKDQLELSLNSDLEWQPLPSKKASRVVQYKAGDFQNEEEWPSLFEWLREKSERFHDVFSKKIKNL